MKNVVFDTDIDEFTSRELWSHLKGRSNIIIVIENESGYVFGTFHKKLPQQQEQWQEDDNQHFVFTIINPYQLQPQTFPIKPTWKKSLYIYADDQTCDVFGIYNAFWISNNGDNFIRLLFKNGYEDASGIGNTLFTNNVYPETFEVNRVLCLQLLSNTNSNETNE
ncbi:TLDc domain-containing protein [Entamoeba marina]